MKHSFLYSLVMLLFVINPNDSFSQKLKAGSTIPKITISDINGKLYSGADFKDKKVVVTFFRYAGCPVCNFRMHELMEEYSQLQSDGFEVIAIFESSAETLQKYSKDIEIPFIVLADPNLELYKKFGVERSFGKTLRTMFKKKPKKDMKKGKKLYEGKKYKKDGKVTQIPADFIIKNGIILKAYYGKYVGDHLPLARINQF